MEAKLTERKLRKSAEPLYAILKLPLMKTIGIDIDNDRAIFYILEENNSTIKNITNDFKYIKLSDDRDNNEVREFQSVIFSHFDSINKCAERIPINFGSAIPFQSAKNLNVKFSLFHNSRCLFK